MGHAPASRRTSARIALAGVVFAVFVAIGPRASFDGTSRSITLPADLDLYLEETESRFSDIVPGTEKRIVWAFGLHERTDVAIVYLHGFSASHRDTSPLAEMVAARLKANLYLARLAGHGRGSTPLDEFAVKAWSYDAGEAWEIGRRLGRRVVLMGHSSGATLALWLAGRVAREELLALVLLSPNFGPADPKAGVLLWPWGGVVAELLEGRWREWTPANELQERTFTTRYQTRALLPMMALVQATKALPLEENTVPTFVAYCPDDRVVDVREMEQAFARMGGPKRIVPVLNPGDPERHVLAGEILSPETTKELARETTEFLEAHT
jgi:pimeloyl-ACP methyl ester carboxylesterase